MKDQKKSGILLSYVNTALSMVINIFLTPLLITTLSDETYSIYKVMQSFAGPLVIFNLGLATITARCVAKYRAADGSQLRDRQNSLAMALIVAAVMAVVVVLGSCLLALQIPRIYGENYSRNQILLAKKLFHIFALSAAVNILIEALKGFVSGNERFVFYYGTRTLHYVFKLGLTVVLLRMGFGAVGAALVDLLNNLLILTLLIWYAFCRLRERPHLYHWNKIEFRVMMSFSAAILLQAIVNQVNNNVDLMILGAMVADKRVITMYSSALSIYLIYSSLITVFSSVFFPKAVRLMEKSCSGEELTNFVIVPGRVQAMIAVLVLGGFALMGREFIALWIGSEYGNAYHVALMLMIPVTIPLVQNVCLSILDAQLKRMFRSVVLVIMAGFNLLATLFLVRVMDFWGAALATVLSLLIGHGLMMNIYYQKVIGLNVVRMFREIFRGVLPSGLAAAALCYPLTLIGGHSWVLFMIRCAVYCVIFGSILWLFGMNPREKEQLRSMLKGR